MSGLVDGSNRSSGQTVQEILDEEAVPVPARLREQNFTYTGSEPLSVERYFSPEFHKKEVEAVWTKCWQMVCQEEDIPEVGDHIIYEINDSSIIIVRSAPDEIKALHNSCLHRGRPLRDDGGNVKLFQCPYHSFTWKIDGTFKSLPCAWDFEHIDRKNFDLPEAKVGTWGGFVFINMDQNSISLEQYLGVVPEHFADYRYDTKARVAYVGKVMNMNWKIGCEAFIESFHVIGTHPQILEATADCNTQYDNYEGEYYNRMITVMGKQSPHLGKKVDENLILRNLTAEESRVFETIEGERVNVTVPDGMTARSVVANAKKDDLNKFGIDTSEMTNSELLDAIQYFVFPNFYPWGGHSANIVYRFRPHDNDPDWCFMEVMLLADVDPKVARPAPAPLRLLKDDEPWASAPELGGLGAVFDQDAANMERMQRGLKASKTGVVQLGNYQESRVRDLHRMIDRQISIYL